MEHVRVKPVVSGDASLLLQAFTGLAVALLVMLGVGGTLYKFLAPGGLLAQVFARSVAGGLAAILALLMIGASVWLMRDLFSTGDRSRHAESFVYGFAAAGAFYATQIFALGGL